MKRSSDVKSSLNELIDSGGSRHQHGTIGASRRGREGDGTPLQYSRLENPRDGGAWWAAVHGVAKSQAWLSIFTFTFLFHALEKEMATHSSTLAWRIPGTEESRAAVYGVAHSRTQLKRLSSSSSNRRGEETERRARATVGLPFQNSSHGSWNWRREGLIRNETIVTTKIEQNKIQKNIRSQS